MQPIHRTLLEVNEEFLVAETPVTPFLEALLRKHVLNDLDLQQLSSLEPQGPRAVKRFVLHVLPLRGPLAYPSLLEALQEAQAQHLVDLLLEGEAVLSAAVKPIELPEVPEPPKRAREDPNEYARKLTTNKDLIEDVVNPEHVIQPLLQNGVMTSLEEGLLESVLGQHVLTWTVLWGVVLQRGLRAYHAFMGALLQNGYSALLHTIEETKVTGVEAMKSTLHRNMMAANTITHPPDNHNHRSNNDASELPFSTREVEAGPPPLRATSQQSVFSGRGREVLPSITPRSHASPLQPGYSQGDLDLLYTPRTNLQVKESGPQDPAETSRSADLLYNPTWTDPYNHLRGADVVSPYSAVYRRNSPFGALENDSARSSTDVFPPRRVSLDLSDLNHQDIPTENDHPQPSGSNPDDPSHALLLAKLDAISERESESGTGSLVGETAKLSTDNASDQVPTKPEKDPDQRRKSSLPERSRTHGVPRARSKSSHSGVPRLKLDPDPPRRTSLTYRVKNN